MITVIDCPLYKTIEEGIIRKADVFLHHKLGHHVPVSIKTIPLYENENID